MEATLPGDRLEDGAGDTGARDSVSDFFPTQSDEEALARCPEIIGSIVGDVLAAVPASAPCVATAALAIAAAAVGPNTKHPRSGRPGLCAMFNLVVTHAAPRTLTWFDALASPFIERVLEMQMEFTRDGPAYIRKIVAQLETDLKNASRTIRPDPGLVGRLRDDGQRYQSRLKPFVATARLSLREAAQFLPESFDGAMTAVALGSDPGDDLLRLRQSERAALAELLNRSWSGIPLSIGAETHAGLLSILWQTRRGPAEILGGRGFDPGAFLPAPILLLQEPKVPSSSAMPSLPNEAVWRQALDMVFDVRCLNRELTYEFSPEAEAVMEKFRSDVDQRLGKLPARLRAHAVWLPDLAAHLALLFCLLAGQPEAVIGEKTAADAVAVTTWIGRQHLISVAPALSVAGAALADGTDRAGAMLAKIEARGPLTRRDLWVSYDNPRASWFGPTLQGLLSVGRVRLNERKQLVACE